MTLTAVPIYISLVIIYISRHFNKTPNKESKAIVIESFDEDKKMLDNNIFEPKLDKNFLL